jgi:PCI domain
VILAGAQDDFMENARLLVFETYCRIHQCIDLQMLADKLGMEKQAAETWVVNLIRNARLNAKIDSKVLYACLLLRPRPAAGLCSPLLRRNAVVCCCVTGIGRMGATGHPDQVLLAAGGHSGYGHQLPDAL